MVGHTGVWDATITALGVIDAQLGQVADAIAAVEAADPDGPGAALFVTADHGNADDMVDAEGNPVTKHSLNPVPLLGDGPRPGGAHAAGRGPRGRRADHPRARRAPALGRHDRPLPVVRSLIGRTCYHPASLHLGGLFPVNPILAIGQILLSIALIAAILLQSRGTGLSGTFGGDSAVYRSRRGVERRLWQFTILLLVLFVLFAVVSFVVN